MKFILKYPVLVALMGFSVQQAAFGAAGYDNSPDVNHVKIEFKRGDALKGEFQQFATGFFVDEQSQESSNRHDCDRQSTYMATSNDLFKFYPPGEKVKIKVQMRSDELDKDGGALDKEQVNVYVDADATLKYRDFFSGVALLTLDPAAPVWNELHSHRFRLKCVGTNVQTSVGSNAETQRYIGFRYYSLNDAVHPTSLLDDRGLKGAWFVDYTIPGRPVEVGMLIGDYFKASASKNQGIRVEKFGKLNDFLNNVYSKTGGGVYSARGGLFYIPGQRVDYFAFRGTKDAFVLGFSEGQSGSQPAEILGAPSEVLAPANTPAGLTYGLIPNLNGFGNLKRTIGSNYKFYLKGVDSKRMGSLESAVQILSETSSLLPHIYEIEAKSEEASFSFFVGNMVIEYVSVMKWIGDSGVAIYDSVRDKKAGAAVTRRLDSQEQAAMADAHEPLQALYSAVLKNQLQINAKSAAEAGAYYDDLQDKVNLLKKVFLIRSQDPRPRFTDAEKNATMANVQSWIQEMAREVQRMRGQATRPTSNPDDLPRTRGAQQTPHSADDDIMNLKPEGQNSTPIMITVPGSNSNGVPLQDDAFHKFNRRN